MYVLHIDSSGRWRLSHALSSITFYIYPYGTSNVHVQGCALRRYLKRLDRIFRELEELEKDIQKERYTGRNPASKVSSKWKVSIYTAKNRLVGSLTIFQNICTRPLISILGKKSCYSLLSRHGADNITTYNSHAHDPYHICCVRQQLEFEGEDGHAL